MNIYNSKYPLNMQYKLVVLESICIAVLLIFIHYEMQCRAFYTGVHSVALSEFIRNCRTGDILFTKYDYSRPKFAIKEYCINVAQTLATGIPFSHVAVIIRSNDIPQAYHDAWGISADSDVLVYSSEAVPNYDLITHSTKIGNSLRPAAEYISSYNGSVAWLPRIAVEAVALHTSSVCAYMHAHRNRLFNLNAARYINLKLRLWKNTYNPEKAICSETCYDFLKKLGVLQKSQTSSANAGLLEIYQEAKASGKYDEIALIIP